MEDNSKVSYFFLGLGIGVAAGILFAPKSGSETRDLLRSRADKSRDYLRRRGGEIRESATELVDRTRDAVTRQREQLNAAVEAGRKAYRETVSGAGEA
jgi:gas vesicle protein